LKVIKTIIVIGLLSVFDASSVLIFRHELETILRILNLTVKVRGGSILKVLSDSHTIPYMNSQIPRRV